MTNLVFVPVDFGCHAHRHESLRLLNEYASSPIGQGRALDNESLYSVWDNLANRQSWAHVFLTYLEGHAIALAITLEGFSTFECQPLLNIHDFYVAQSYQGQGIGTYFLRELMKHAKQSGFGKLTLEVLSENFAAKRLYYRLGFSPYKNPVGGTAEFWQCYTGDPPSSQE